MTDKEIIKALEHCSGNGKCRDCSYYKFHAECLDILDKDVLALINRKQAEIERLNANFVKVNKIVKAIKLEAIKEFAEKVKDNQDKLFNYIYSEIGFCAQINRLVKEMVGDEE